MKNIVCISDTHGHHRKINHVPNGDILIHAGDITNKGEIEILEDFSDWLKNQPHSIKIVIAGNHDFCFEREPNLSRKILEDNGIIYLQHESITIDEFHFFGSPYTPRFGNWAFNVDPGPAIERLWNQIPNYTNILITHGPAYQKHDFVLYESVGCQDLQTRIEQLEQLRLFVFGHIHEGYGTSLDENNILYVNPSICAAPYERTKLFRAPIIVSV